MCFSLLASVAAGATLTAAGVVTVKLVRRRAELPLALLPLLFGVQQLIEGVVWWSLHHNAATLITLSSLAFTLFSHVLWPIFVPLTYLCMETVAWRRKALSAFLGVGTCVCLHGIYTVVGSPSAAHVAGSSIRYGMPSWYVIALYLVATCVSAFFSSLLLLRALGAAALVLALFTLWLYTAVFVSVWCFFSAVLTVVIFLYFSFRRRDGWSATAAERPRQRTFTQEPPGRVRRTGGGATPRSARY